MTPQDKPHLYPYFLAETTSVAEGSVSAFCYAHSPCHSGSGVFGKHGGFPFQQPVRRHFFERFALPTAAQNTLANTGMYAGIAKAVLPLIYGR